MNLPTTLRCIHVLVEATKSPDRDLRSTARSYLRDAEAAPIHEVIAPLIRLPNSMLTPQERYLARQIR